MVKLHSNACAKGLIAVMGDTPELVGTDSELDFVEVSFGRMCQTPVVKRHISKARH
jgi:hypothetical protein